jgi:lysophospholipase L1-like esterase
MTPTAPTAIRPRRGWTIVFEGDSNTNRRTPPSLDTWPYLQLMNWHQTWADELTRLAFCWRPDLRLKFHNAAVGGSNCRGITQRLEPMVLPHRPDLVLVSVGSNDPNQGVGMPEFKRTMRDYVRRVQAAGGRVGFLGGFGIHKAKNRVPYHRELSRIAKELGGGYLDVGEALRSAERELKAQWHGHTLDGDSHLNAVGALVVAGAALKWLGLGPR